jgi:hypothetical protein
MEGSNARAPAFTSQLAKSPEIKKEENSYACGNRCLGATFSTTELLAKPKGGAKGNAHGAKGLARADAVAGLMV